MMDVVSNTLQRWRKLEEEQTGNGCSDHSRLPDAFLILSQLSSKPGGVHPTNFVWISPRVSRNYNRMVLDGYILQIIVS